MFLCLNAKGADRDLRESYAANEASAIFVSRFLTEQVGRVGPSRAESSQVEAARGLLLALNWGEKKKKKME